SVKKGEALVSSGEGKTTPCAVCHGADLSGLGPVPGIAGRSPSYLVRQLYDMQQGARGGAWTELMKPVVAKLTTDDMLAVAAYLPSRGPAQAAAPAAAVPDAAALLALGKARYNAYRCYDCHGMEGTGTDDGPDLTTQHMTAEQIGNTLRKPSS